MNFTSNQQQKYLTHPLRNKVTAWWLHLRVTPSKSEHVKPTHTYIHKEWICGCSKNANVISFERKCKSAIYRFGKDRQACVSADPSRFFHALASHPCEINNRRTSHSVSAWSRREIRPCTCYRTIQVTCSLMIGTHWYVKLEEWG